MKRRRERVLKKNCWQFYLKNEKEEKRKGSKERKKERKKRKEGNGKSDSHECSFTFIRCRLTDDLCCSSVLLTHFFTVFFFFEGDGSEGSSLPSEESWSLSEELSEELRFFLAYSRRPSLVL